MTSAVGHAADTHSEEHFAGWTCGTHSARPVRRREHVSGEHISSARVVRKRLQREVVWTCMPVDESSVYEEDVSDVFILLNLNRRNAEFITLAGFRPCVRGFAQLPPFEICFPLTHQFDWYHEKVSEDRS